jgi:hypothetical protein
MFQRRRFFTAAILFTSCGMIGFGGNPCLERASAQEKALWQKKMLGAGAVPLPDRIAQADLVVRGKVTAVEDKSVPVAPLPGSADKVAYRVLGLKVDEVLIGDKDTKKIRVGHGVKINPPQVPPPQALAIEEGWEGLFFLKKHHQGKFYVNFSFFNGMIPASESDFNKSLETSRTLAKIILDPVAALKAENADNRYLAVAMLIGKFRPRVVKGQHQKEEPIDAGVSKLLLKALAEADWKYDRNWLDVYPAHPYDLFKQLGVTKVDGYEPPATGDRDTLAATHKWLLDHQNKYTVKRLVLE